SPASAETPAAPKQEQPEAMATPAPAQPEAPVQPATPAEKAPEAVAETPAQPAVIERPEAVPAIPESPSAPAGVESAATEVHDIQITPNGEKSADVILVGNGSFQYDVFELSNPQRLVIDLKSVTIASSVRNTQSGQGLFSKVRIAQYQMTPKVV